MNEIKKNLLLQIVSGVIVAVVTAVATGLVTNHFTKKGIMRD